jgi:RNA polymerase sigma-70 factor, ECF subfamily
LPTVNATPTIDGSGDGPSPGTLGALLYAKPATVRVTEAEWVGLVKAVAGGDQLALQTLYGRLHRIVYTLLLRITKSRASAEELTVDVFHEVWRRAASYDASCGTVVGWIMTQARTRAIDRLRFEHRKKRVNPHPEDPEGEDGPDGTTEALMAAEQEKLLRQALVKLNIHERQAIETAFFSECTYLETANRLNQPIGTIKTRIRSALAKLRQTLDTGLGKP